MSHTKNHDYGDMRGQEFDENNNLQVNSRDSIWRQSFNTLFWDRITWSRVPTLSSQFFYPLEEWRAIIENENWWSVNNNNSQLRLLTDSQQNSKTIVTWTFYLRYIPWQEAYNLFSAVFNTPQWDDSYQRVWIFDWNDWFYVWYSWSDFVFWYLRNWVREEYEIDVNNVYPQEIWEFDPEKWNIYRITFSFLWFWPISYEVMSPSWGWFKLWQIQFPNSSKETNISTPYLPVRWEIFNWVSWQSMELSIWSVTTWIVDWTSSDPWARRFAFNSWDITLNAWENTLVIFRNKSTFWWKENRVNSLLTLVSAATEWTKPVNRRFIENADITTPWIWTDVDTNNSIMDYNLTWVVDSSTWRDILDWNMKKEDSFFQKLNEQSLILRPWEWVWIVTDSENATTASISVRWQELF